MAEAKPIPRLEGNQALAAAPHAHAWVSASAGTGKTQVLVARVLRLLLSGAEPERLLCITFTKAGAAEMAERLNATLARWVRLDARKLRGEVFNLLGREIDDAIEAEARTLFARVLEARGGLRIVTIHAFAQSLLAAFPVEAGVAPGFTALDDRSRAVVVNQVLAEVLVEAERNRDPVLGDFAAMSVRLGDGGVVSKIMQLVGHGAAILDRFPIRDSIAPVVRSWLELPSGDIEAAIAEACSDDRFDLETVRRIAAANAAWNTKTGLAHADSIAAWLGASAPVRAESLSDLIAVVCKADGGLRAVTKGQEAADPAYADLAERLRQACAALIDLRERAALADWLAGSLRVGWTVASAYAEEKRRRGVIDYDDMIEKAAALLEDKGIGLWVRYKLDQRIDHILIDEAQDTNAAQWRIAGALTEEFFVGEGARGIHRTMFAVGDFKQAIFSFQGTDPREFESARKMYRELAEQADEHFHDLDLDRSFRSTGAVLDVVDQVLADLGHDALGLPAPPPPHVPARADAAGEVILLPPVAGQEAGDDEAGEEEWLNDADRSWAAKLAKQLAGWLHGPDPMILKARGRPLRPEDVMILVRSRGDFTALLLARLHEEGVRVAGVDRLRLTAPLAVQDLLALIRFVLQTEDDLTLATLLVSPLIGWSQEDLFGLAYGRGSVSLWRRLRTRAADGDVKAGAAADWLRQVLAMADYTAPYEFLETVLSGPLGGRAKLLARLREEARDPIDELLNAALQFEDANPPSLQGFLDWIEREDVEVKRDPSAPLDAVRIMTVHGSKGLQAPLVILADATRDPENSRPDLVLFAPDGEAVKVPLLCTEKEARGAIAEAAAKAALREREEHWRLLYVAMTRAEDVLVAGGALGPKMKGAVPERSWHAAIGGALDALGAEAEDDVLWPGIRRYHTGRPRPGRPVRERTQVEFRLPDWARRLPPEEPVPPRPLSPSALGEDDVPRLPFGPAAAAAALRGSLLHALFERLPAVPPERRRKAADVWLAKPGRAPDPEARLQIIEDALAVIEHPDFTDIFAPEALAEAPIAAVVNGRTIAGTVDRLLVGVSHIRVIDFKTGLQVPEDASAVPVYYLKQMAAYAAALAIAFPGRVVEAGLLYTGGPRLIWLPQALLSANVPFAPQRDD